MKLLSSNFSPFSTRVRIQIAKKNLAIDICAPQPTLRTPEFLAKFPLGKIPVLVFDDDTHIAESWAIMEYLEAAYPEVSLRPEEPLAIAQMNMLCRYADLHLGPALFPMFVSLLTGGDVDKEKEIHAIGAMLDKGERMLATMPEPTSRALNIGDIALACNVFFTVETPKLFGCDNILADFPKFTAWWQWVKKDQAISAGIQQMQDAFDGYLASKTSGENNENH